MAKGLYTPINPQKYLGDPTKIRFLSSWERSFMYNCDINQNILGWSSEEMFINYFHPIKKRQAKYYPDFIIKYKNQSGQVITEMIEIKPKKQSVVSKNMSIYDKLSLVINQAKWQAAVAMCERAGIKFRVLTEQELFIQKPKKTKQN